LSSTAFAGGVFWARAAAWVQGYLFCCKMQMPSKALLALLKEMLLLRLSSDK
jgi:hypothetical protein